MSRSFALTLLLLGCDPGGAPAPIARVQQANTTDGLADSVFGQPNLTSGSEPLVVASNTTHKPVAVAAAALPLKTDPNPLFFIADPGAHRVLGVFSSELFAQVIAGQFGYNRKLPNHGTGVVSQQSLNTPTAVAFSYEQVAIADTGNHRVLLAYRTSGTPLYPYTVYGQHNRMDSANRNDGGAITADTLADPGGVAFDATFSPGRLLIADTGNHRVLAFNIVTTVPPATTAAQCFGQDDCTTGLANRGGAVSALGFNEPRGLATDNTIGGSHRGFYVADTGNHRVLHFPVFATAPDIVYGQDGDFTTAIPSKGGISASSLRSPSAVAVDSIDGSIYVADTDHHRVLHFPKGKTVADRVLGQPSFTSGEAPMTASASRMRAPTGVALTINELFVADSGFSRVLRFRTCDTKCDDFNPCTDDSCDNAGNCRNLLRPHSKECAPYFCDASAKACSRPCDGSRPCQAPYKCINGTCAIACTSDGQCASIGRTCVDGFCCDSPCGGDCERCNEPGNEGTCKPFPEGAPQSPRSCGIGSKSTGECGLRCDGFDGSRCKIARAGARCGTESCTSGVVSKRGSCDGVGSCNVLTDSCVPYACDVNACRSSCRFEVDCAPGHTCSNGACVGGSGGAAAGGGCAYERHANGLAGLVMLAAVAASIRRRR